MYCSIENIWITGTIFMIFFSWITAFVEAEEDKTLNLKIGFDLKQGKNGSPSLQIRNFEGVPDFRRKNLHQEKEQPKKSIRAETSSGSDENSNEKSTPEGKNVREGAPSPNDGSDDVDTSGSDENRRLSTKGLAPDEFEPEQKSGIHGRYKGSDSE